MVSPEHMSNVTAMITSQGRRQTLKPRQLSMQHKPLARQAEQANNYRLNNVQEISVASDSPARRFKVPDGHRSQACDLDNCECL